LIVLAVGGLRAFSTLNTPSISPAPTRSTDVPTAAITEPPTAQSSGLPDGANMVKISAGEYEVGTAQFTDEFHTAVRRVNLNDFWIDKYQVTNQQYEQFIQATGAAQPVIWPAADEKYPVRGVTWDQAEAYCEWAGKRLPSEAEWEAAGRGAGPNPQLYPWGNDPTADGKALDLPDQDTYEIGTLPFNVSPFGVFDLVGNVWEWVGQPYSAVQDGFQILRGGRFGVAQDLAYRLAVAPHDERYVKYAGFRCAADQVK
jgi:formylglycine-generating enzyme required for sulfatase activity